MDTVVIALAIPMFLLGVLIHEGGHAAARKWKGMSFRIEVGRGPCLYRSQLFALHLLPLGARTKGDRPTSPVVPLAGPLGQLLLAMVLLPLNPWLAVLGGLGSLTLLPYRVKGHPSDGLFALQLFLKGAYGAW